MAQANCFMIPGGPCISIDLPEVAKVAPTDSVLGTTGTMDLPALNKVAPTDTLEGVNGTMDLPALAKVAPTDTLEGVAGTMDLPAITSVDPLDTLETVAGAMDVPALTSVDPLDTLRTIAGTMDVPTLNKVAPSDTLRGLAGTMDIPAIASVDPLDTLEGVLGTLDLPALNKVAPSSTLRTIAGTMDIPAINKVAPTDTLEGVPGTMDLPAINKVAPTDTLEGVPGTMDLPAINKVAPTDTLEGVPGTMDLPAITSVDPLDTLEGAAGTMDVPALASVDPLDTLRTLAGTMDVPALNKVAPSDTLRGLAGTMDLPAITSVDPLDTLEGVAGTMDVPVLNSVLTNDTLRGVPGNWNVANLGIGSEANVVAPVAFGLGQIGTGGGGGGGPVITRISEVALSTEGGQTMTITGTNFGAGMGACNLGDIISWNAVQVVVKTFARNEGNFDFTLTDAALATTTATVEFADPPSIPQDVHANALSPYLVGLTWGFAKGSTGTDVYRSTHPTTGFARIAKNVQDNFYNDDDRHPDTYYYYKLKSVSNILEVDSDYSDVAGVKTQTSVAPPTPVIDGFDRAPSAMSFAATTGLEAPLSLAGNFTIMFWLKDVDSHCNVLNAFDIAIDNGNLILNQGVQTISQRLNWTSGWASLFIRRTGDEIAIGKNGAILNTFLATSTPSFAGTLEIMKNEIGKLFDLQIHNSAISDDAYAYYYRDVTRNNGDALLPLWL